VAAASAAVHHAGVRSLTPVTGGTGSMAPRT
jgi:hypothetical protein